MSFIVPVILRVFCCHMYSTTLHALLGLLLMCARRFLTHISATLAFPLPIWDTEIMLISTLLSINEIFYGCVVRCSVGIGVFLLILLLWRFPGNV